MKFLKRLFHKQPAKRSAPQPLTDRQPTLDVDHFKSVANVKSLLAAASSTREDIATAAAKALGEIDLSTWLADDSYCVDAVTYLSLFYRDAEGHETYSREVKVLEARERLGEPVSLSVKRTMMMEFAHKLAISDVNLRYIGLHPKTTDDARALMTTIGETLNQRGGLDAMLSIGERATWKGRDKGWN